MLRGHFEERNEGVVAHFEKSMQDSQRPACFCLGKFKHGRKAQSQYVLVEMPRFFGVPAPVSDMIQTANVV